MRIAHFVHRYPPALGGAEAYFGRLSTWLHGKGHHVEVFTTNAHALEAFWKPHARLLPAGTTHQNGVAVHRYPPTHFPGRRYLLKAVNLIPSPRLQAFTLPCNPLAPRMWAAAGTRRDFDLVHASAFPYAFPILCALRLARRLKVPFFLTPFLHLGDPDAADDRTRRQYLSPPLLYLLRQADAIFVQTGVEAAAVRKLGLPPERIYLQGLGVEPSECTGGSRTAAAARWQLRNEDLHIGHLANLSEEKGSCDLLRALLPLWAAGQRSTALLAGPRMPNFNAFLATLPAQFQSHVRLLGELSDAEKRDFFAALDLFALPSRSDSFGLVLLEAWANAVACVGYRAGGVAEVIHHESDGLLAPCGDVAGLTACLQRLMADRELRRRQGLAGQARVLRENRWEDKLGIVLREYQRAVPPPPVDTRI